LTSVRHLVESSVRDWRRLPVPAARSGCEQERSSDSIRSIAQRRVNAPHDVAVAAIYSGWLSSACGEAAFLEAAFFFLEGAAFFFAVFFVATFLFADFLGAAFFLAVFFVATFLVLLSKIG